MPAVAASVVDVISDLVHIAMTMIFPAVVASVVYSGIIQQIRVYGFYVGVLHLIVILA